jgi:serine/threonine-protein kinase
MLVDLKNAARRLTEGNESTDGTEDNGDVEASTDAQVLEGSSRSVMIIESNVDMQNVLRRGLKRRGYRVLVISDPQRALERFSGSPDLPAQCVVFSTADVGEPALEAFNQFAQGRDTKTIPAVLLLGEEHAQWKSKAKLAGNHVVLSMPVRMGEFRAQLKRLIEEAEYA